MTWFDQTHPPLYLCYFYLAYLSLLSLSVIFYHVCYRVLSRMKVDDDEEEEDKHQIKHVFNPSKPIATACDELD